VPTYEYACKECDEHLEVQQSFSDPPLTACPACGGPLRKVFGSIGIAFKGSGFYKTDSRASHGKTKSGAAASSGSSEGSGSGSGSAGSGSSSSGSGSSGSGSSGSGSSGSGSSGSGSSGSGSSAAAAAS